MPHLLSYTITFTLQPRKNHGKTSVRVAEKCQVGTISFVDRATVAAATLLAGALEVGQVSPSICRVAELRGSQHQLTLWYTVIQRTVFTVTGTQST